MAAVERAGAAVEGPTVETTSKNNDSFNFFISHSFRLKNLYPFLQQRVDVKGHFTFILK